MQPKTVTQSISMIEYLLSLHRIEPGDAGRQLWRITLEPLDEDLGKQAVQRLVQDCKFPPKPADLREIYADLLGIGETGESIEDFLSRKRYEQAAGRKLHAELAAKGLDKHSCPAPSEHPGSPALTPDEARSILREIQSRIHLPELPAMPGARSRK